MEKDENIKIENKSTESNLIIPGIKKVVIASCTVTINNIKAKAFFASLPINLGNRYPYGLIINKSVLTLEQFNDGATLNIYFEESKKVIDYQIPKDAFVFSCDFLDVTFIEIPKGTFDNVEYLRLCEEPLCPQKIYLIKYSNNGELSHVEGETKGLYGYDIIYNIPNNNKDLDLFGAAIISLSKVSLGDVVAIFKSATFGGRNNVALHMNIFLRAIRSLVHQNRIEPEYTLSGSKELSPSEINILNQEGLQSTNNPLVFISPASPGITALWFYRTHYCWFWTPKEPHNFNMDEIKKCNWSIIQGTYPIAAIGGPWNGFPPADRNVNLIEFLRDSGLKFLGK